MLIIGLNKTTLLDYPGCVAATIFTGGCNFRCPFCHNGGLVLEPLSQQIYSEEEVLIFLEKRKKLLKGICITGGEPTLQADLPKFLSKVKKMGYRVKLDTNGSKPEVLENLLAEKLLDYVAVDIKNCPEKYAMTAGLRTGEVWKQIQDSIKILSNSSILYEFRTTVVKELHTKEDLMKIGEWIKGCPFYYLQQYQDTENVLGRIMHQGEEARVLEGTESISNFEILHGYEKEEMEGMADAVRKVPGMMGKVILRGI